MSEPRERPILMSAPMVRAILDGRKSQTRRVVRPTVKGCRVGTYSEDGRGVVEVVNIEEDGDPADAPPIRCPYGLPVDRLWVKETFAVGRGTGLTYYRADRPDAVAACADKWKPSIFMPRLASRITLEVTEVRVQRVQEISEADAHEEGIPYTSEVPVEQYEALWDSINGKRPGCSWRDNPWCWAISFRRLP